MQQTPFPVEQVSPLQAVVRDDDRLSRDEEWERFGPWEDDDYDKSLYR